MELCLAEEGGDLWIGGWRESGRDESICGDRRGKVGNWECRKQQTRVGLDLQLKKKEQGWFVPRSGTAAKRVGKRMRWGSRGTWVEMGINSTEALKPMGKCSGVSPWLEGGDATSCKKTGCYFWCQKQVGGAVRCFQLGVFPSGCPQGICRSYDGKAGNTAFLHRVPEFTYWRIWYTSVTADRSVVHLVQFTVFLINYK